MTLYDARYRTKTPYCEAPFCGEGCGRETSTSTVRVDISRTLRSEDSFSLLLSLLVILYSMSAPKRSRDVPRRNRNLVAEFADRQQLPKADSPEWKYVGGNKENILARSGRQAALMDFDTCASLGPKIGLRRLDRLVRADALGIPVSSTARTLIESDKQIGEYVYTEFPPRYN